MEAIETFLKRRGVEPEAIKRMTEEKIDCDAVVVMSDNELAKYIPAYGDRVALMAFARCLTKPEENTDPRSGFSTCGIGVRGNAKRAGPPSGNRNAIRKQRRIDIGWLNCNSTGQTYKQVRSINGGGTRLLALDRCCTMENVKDAAVGKFFPEGRCKIGNLEDFDIELRDFKGDPLSANFTLEELHKSSNLKTLKAYIYTTPTSKKLEGETSQNNQTQSTAEIGAESVTPVHNQAQPAAETGLDSGTPEVNFHPRHINRLSRTQTAGPSSSRRDPWRERLQTALVNLVESSDDDDLQTAIEASLTETVGVPVTASGHEHEEETGKSKEEILQQLNAAVDRTTKKNMINVTRQNVIEGAIRGFQRRTFDPHAELNVIFVGEEGIDDGGLTRRFMRLLKKAISQQPIFCGNEGSKQLALHAPGLDKGLYKIVGEMLAYMLVHKGPTPNFLDPFMYAALSKGIDSVSAEISNVGEEDIRDKLQKIAASTNASDFFDAIEPLECITRVSGNASLANPDRKDELVKALCQYLVVDNLKPAYVQFSEGLKAVGVLQAIQLYGNTMKPFFIYKNGPITAEDIFRLYKPAVFSLDGSNRKKREDGTLSWWRDMVLDMEGEDNLPSLLAFLTGLDEIPPLGFDCGGSITFRHREELVPDDPTREFPLINTCSLELGLPILDTYDIFVERFTAAMSVDMFTRS